MKKIFLSTLIVLLCGATSGLFAQFYFTKEGKIDFTSNAPLEKIEAVNSNVTSVLSTEDGKIQFDLLIKAFQFEKALMQEHFNENYMESTKYPKAKFKGQIDNIKDIDFGKTGEYEATVSGDLTIHGETKPVTAKGTITVGEESLSTKSTFVVAVADYGIKIPKVVRDNIAKEVEIVVDMDYKPLKK